ncbi:MAG: SpoIIE family protein phosphatase [Chloroflexi bacterium]|nr:SpoIIE family protein phosphatase [Chloroflexota bacterium]
MSQSSQELALSQVPLFATLPQSEISYLAETLQAAEVQPGTVLFHEGEYGDRFYIVYNGQIEIIKALGTADERLVGVRGSGEYVGEMSLFNRDGLRTASARARAATQVLEMTRADFDSLLNRQPTLAYEMVRVLSMRLHEAHNTTIRDLHEKNRQITEAYESLKAAQAQLVEKEKLEHELHVAREVQAALLPRATPRLAGWEFAARWQPARNVSGDYYDFIPLSRGPGWGFVIADVSGKGMPAALFMALTRSIVRASVVGAALPADGINRANQLICADSGQGMFVTLFYACLDPATGDLTYVNAGHNPPWLYRAEGDQWLELTRTGMALGMFKANVLTQNTLRLNAGDFIFMYTDGLTDVTNVEGEKFGAEQLLQIITEHRRAPPAEIIAALDETISRFQEGNTLFDDITLVIAKRI